MTCRAPRLCVAAWYVTVAPTDSDGSYSTEEMPEAYPDLTEQQFAETAANADGEIDASRSGIVAE